MPHVYGGVALKKKCGNAPKKSHFQSHFKIIFQSVFNEVFTFITLPTKTSTVFWGATQKIACHLFIDATSRATHRKSE